jgi:hypothetical protein
MTDTDGIKTVLHPASGAAAAKAVHPTLLQRREVLRNG